MYQILTPHVLCFFTSVIVGAAICFLSFGFLFRKVHEIFDDIIYDKTIKHRDREKVAMEAAVVPPAKVETICQLATYNDGIVGERAFKCRAVIYANSITFYAIDDLVTLPDHRQVVKSEHLLGKINLSCVTSSSVRLSRYHRHLDVTSRIAPLKGKVVVVSAINDLPLFLIDPSEARKKLIHALDPESNLARFPLSTDDQWIKNGDNKSVVGDAHEKKKVSDRKWKNDDDSTTNGSTARSNIRSEKETWYGTEEGQRQVELLRSAHQILIKFPSLRENERWLNLLNISDPTSQHWTEFLSHLPCADVLNILIARIFVENTRTSYLNNFLKEKVAKKIEIAVKSLPPQLKGTTVFLVELSIGSEIPLVTNVSDAVVNNTGDLSFDFDVLYRGGLKMVICFDITYRGVKVRQIGFTFQLLELSGRIHFLVGPPPSRRFFLGCLKMPDLQLNMTQEEVNDKGVLHWLMKFLPNLSGIATSIMKNSLFEDMMLPSMDDFPFPVVGEDSSEDEKDEEEEEEESVDDSKKGKKAKKKEPESSGMDGIGDLSAELNSAILHSDV